MKTQQPKLLFNTRKAMNNNRKNKEKNTQTGLIFSLKWFYYKVHEDLQYYKRICQHAKNRTKPNTGV